MKLSSLKYFFTYETKIPDGIGFKLFGIQFTKPYDYVYGCFAYEQKHFKTIIMNKFVFEII